MTKFFSAILCLTLFTTLAACGQPNQPPTARIVTPALNDRVNDLTVSFKAESSDDNGIASAIWYFGDGQQEEGGNEITHTYAEGGQYTARYTVTDEQEEEATSSVTFTINRAPRAAARAQITRDGEVLPFVKSIEGVFPLEVQFQGSASRDEDGEIASFSWDFGDGAGASEADPSYTFNQIGQYQVILTVTDNEGKTATDRVVVNVAPKPLEVTDLVDPKGAELPAYTLIRGTTIGPSTANKSVLYSYRLTGERQFSQDEIRLALLDIMLGKSQEPDVSQATVYLFTEPKPGFMEPVDYDHYLGMAVWSRPEGELGADDLARQVVDTTELNYNNAYLSGEALSVVGYELIQSELESDDPRCTICADSRMVYTILILNPEPDDPDEAYEADPLCRQEVDRTIQAVLQRGLQAPGVYALNVFEGGFQVQNGVVLGLWSPDREVDDVDTNLGALYDVFPNQPDSWDLDSPSFKLRYTRELPSCPTAEVAEPEEQSSTPFIQGGP